MKLLATLHESDIFPESEDTDSSVFWERKAARAIVTNELGQVALLKVGNRNYHKLPGGGIDGDENVAEALQRELVEEIGCTADITDEVGEIIEYRDQQKMHQVSYCYLATQVGEQQPPDYTPEELTNGFEMIWAWDIDDAISTLKNDKPTDYSGRFIVRRDLLLLKAAKKLVQ